MKNKKLFKNLSLYIILIFFTLIFILPTVLMIVTAFKQDEMQILKDMNSFRAFLPVGDIGFQNFKDIFLRLPLTLFLKNSLIITILTIVLNVIVNSMLGYALARTQFKGKKVILTIVISLMIIPGEAVMLPLLLLVNKMNLIDTITVQILPSIAEAFTIFLFYQAFLEVPKEIEEAAILDGLNYIQIYKRIAMPLVMPTIVTTSILTGLGKWGDVLWPTMVTRGERVRPLAIGMQQLFTTQPQRWGDIFAFAALMVIPILILFLIFQKHFIRSIASTGVKG